MQSLAVPVISPTELTYVIADPTTRCQTLCILNPFSFEVHFKVDISSPEKFNVSLNRGIISSRQKLKLEVTCIAPSTCKDSVQFRFFKWARPRPGQQKPQPQRYLGYRQLNIDVYEDEQDLREQAPSECGASSTVGSRSVRSSNAARSTTTSSTGGEGRKWQVISKVLMALCLLGAGFLLSYFGDTTVIENIQGQSLAVVCYTLASVLIVQLMTFR